VTIDPRSYEPTYVQLAGLIRAAIERGNLAPGALLPSEASLVQEHGVSRETARRAIALLRNEGRIVTRPGRGSYVRGVTDTDVVYVSREVQVATRMPSAHERQQLELPEGTPVLVVSRPGHEEQVLPGDRTIIEFQD
jgi:GntR family transcriptional regulator